jgi:colicin import membrane protein
MKGTTLPRLVLALAASAAPVTPVWAQSASAPRESPTATVAPVMEGSAEQAAAAGRKAEHERIRREREAIGAERVAGEAQCYQRFAVEDCLKSVRSRARDAEGRLRVQEIELNDAERTEKAAARRRSIEDKQRSLPATAAGNAEPGSTVRKPGHDPQAQKSQRDHEAELRASQQRSRAQAQAQEQSRRSAESAQRAAEARARQAQARESASERRARVEKAQAEAAAKGRSPAAPLPAPSASR